ncbi:penicillin-binding protein 2 [Paenibacillus alkalitolerans]|uniref:hypothetical protein n=1 Tax=Paenibacillus alkalitolerans TaxID=2799335 RepID=UPI0018F4C809|nr:hypothetical protein [Paenibacillus alkalitolerans]
MKRTLHSDDPQQEIVKRRQYTFRINLFFFGIFGLFSVLVMKLAFIQFVEGEELSALESQRTKRAVSIPPIRGNIYDRNGYPIAYSTSTQSLYFRMEPGTEREDLIALAEKITELFAKYGDPTLDQMTVSDVFDAMDVGYDIDGNDKVYLNRMFEPRRVKGGLTDKEISYVMSHPELFPGVEVVEESVRHYDSNTIAAQLVGYLKPFSTANNQKEGQYLDIYRDKTYTSGYLRMEEVGFDGLEFMYQTELRGIRNVIVIASMPDYDPNVWSGGISTELYNQIQPYYQNGAASLFRWKLASLS